MEPFRCRHARGPTHPEPAFPVCRGRARWRVGVVAIARRARCQRNSGCKPGIPLCRGLQHEEAFTSAALAQLVDAGKLDWNDRVQDYLPDFELYDPYVTSELRIADLLCHRSGSGNVFRRLAVVRNYLERRRSAHEHATSNQPVPSAPNSVIKTSSTSPPAKWSSASPATVGRGSSATRFSFHWAWSARCCQPHELAGLENVALPHNELEEGVLTTIDWVNWDNMAPAGALITSVDGYGPMDDCSNGQRSRRR